MERTAAIPGSTDILSIGDLTSALFTYTQQLALMANLNAAA